MDVRNQPPSSTVAGMTSDQFNIQRTATNTAGSAIAKPTTVATSLPEVAASSPTTAPIAMPTTANRPTIERKIRNTIHVTRGRLPLEEEYAAPILTGFSRCRLETAAMIGA